MDYVNIITISLVQKNKKILWLSGEISIGVSIVIFPFSKLHKYLSLWKEHKAALMCVCMYTCVYLSHCNSESFF